MSLTDDQRDVALKALRGAEVERSCKYDVWRA